MPFEPVRTLEDLDSLNDAEMMDGYLSWAPGDPEPGENRGRSYWYGWCNAASDREGRLRPDEAAHRELVRLYLERERARRAQAAANL